jgi:hypothetical protein
MITTVLLIAAGTVVVGLCILALTSRRRGGPRRGRADAGAIDQERAEALRLLARDMDSEGGSRARRDASSAFGGGSFPV